VFLAWYAAVERLGVARTGLFNGLIPVTSLAAVAVVGTGTVTSSLALGAVVVLAGLLLGLTEPADRADRPGFAAPARRRALVR
jgi:drug/metabolite transporter (DMT)-like permease